MPLLRCQKCDHEWEGNLTSGCDWCGGLGYVLEHETPFEKFCKWIVSKEGKKFVVRVTQNIKTKGTSVY